MFRIIRHNRLKQVPAESNIFLITAAAIQTSLVNCYGLTVEYDISKFRNAARYTDQNLRMSVPKVFKHLPNEFNIKYSKALPKRIKLRQVPSELKNKNSFGALIKFDNNKFAFAVNCPRLYLFLEDLSLVNFSQVKDWTTKEIVYFSYTGSTESKTKVVWTISDVELLNLPDWYHKITVTGNNKMECNICTDDCMAKPFVAQLIENGMTADQNYALPYTVADDYIKRVPKDFTAPRRVKDNKTKKGYGNLDDKDPEIQLKFEAQLMMTLLNSGDLDLADIYDDDMDAQSRQYARDSYDANSPEHKERMNELSDNIERLLDNYKPGEYLLEGPDDIKLILQQEIGNLNMFAVIDNVYGIVQSKSDSQFYSAEPIDYEKFTEVFPDMTIDDLAYERGLEVEDLEDDVGDLYDTLEEDMQLKWNTWHLVEEYIFRDTNSKWLDNNPEAIESLTDLIIEERLWEAYMDIVNRFGGYNGIKEQINKLLANTSVFMAVPQQAFVDILTESQGNIIAGAVSSSMASDGGYALERYATEILKLHSNERNYLSFNTYGYLSSKNYPAPAYALTYGDIQFEFHDYIKENTTVCLGDSFHGFNPVSAVNQIKPEFILSSIIGNSNLAAFPSQEISRPDFAAQFIVNLSHLVSFLTNLFNSDPSVGLDYIALFKGVERDATLISYFEAQIKGKLSIEDVKTIYVPESSVGQIYHITQKIKATAKYREQGKMPNFRIHNDSHMVIDKNDLMELNTRVNK